MSHCSLDLWCHDFKMSHCSLDICAAGFGGSVQVPPRLLRLQESQQISGQGFECLKKLEEKTLRSNAQTLFNSIPPGWAKHFPIVQSRCWSQARLEGCSRFLVGRQLFFDNFDSDSDCSERQGVIRIFPRYEEISSFPPNGVERFQFSTRTGHYSQVGFWANMSF